MAVKSEKVESKKSLLEQALKELEVQFGKGSVMSSSFKQNYCDVVSTGSLGLDIATGISGFPRGKIVELMGWESSGKSTICLHTIANAQKLGLKCLLVDGEHSFDKGYAQNLGINVDELIISQPEYGEEGYEVADKLISTGEIGLVVIDSQTSLLPKKVIEGEMGDNAIGLHARLMSHAVPKIMGKAARNNCLVIFISQYREKIGVMFGDPRTTNGGHSLKFYAHMRVEVSKSLEKDGTQAIANKTRCKVIKNKMAPPFKEATFRVLFGKGVDTFSEVIDLAVEKGIIVRSGSWFSYGEAKIGQGIESVIELMKDNPELYNEVKNKVIGV